MKKLGLLSLIMVLSLTFLGCQNELVDTWDETTLFHDGLLGVCIYRFSCGYIDEDFEVVIDYEYQEVSDFMNGLARVKSGGLFGVINLKNKVIVDIIYDKIEIFPEKYIIIATLGDETYFFDYYGKTINSKDYYSELNYDENDLISFYNRTKKLHGYKNIDGKIVIDSVFFSVTEETIRGNTVISDQYGFSLIDNTGNKIMTLDDYIRIEPSGYPETYTTRGISPGWGLIDNEGNNVTDQKYRYRIRFNESEISIVHDLNVSKGLGLINVNGDEILPMEYYTYLTDSIYEGFNDLGLLFLTKDSNYYIYRSDGTRVYTSNEYIEKANDKYVVTRSDDLTYSLHNYNGEELLSGYLSIELTKNNNDIIIAKKSGQPNQYEIYDKNLNKLVTHYEVESMTYLPLINHTKLPYYYFEIGDNQLYRFYDVNFEELYYSEIPISITIYNDGYIMNKYSYNYLITDLSGKPLWDIDGKVDTPWCPIY